MKLTSSLSAAVAAAALFVLGAGCTRGPADAPKPAAVAAVNRGVSLMGQYDYEGAAAAFAEALAADPARSQTKINLAIARFNRGKKEHNDIDEAGRLLDEVLQREPANARAAYFKAIVLQHVGQAEAAIPVLERVLQAQPGDGVAWYLLGLCRQRAGQNPQPDLQRAVELRPYLVSAYYRLWQTLQGAGKPAEAAPYLEQFKKLREHPLAETIEFPQYNQMGDLALVLPLAGPAAPAGPAAYRADPARELARVSAPAGPAANAARPGGAAFLDLRRTGTPLLLPAGWRSATGGLDPAAAPAAAPTLALPILASATALAVGDYDNDETPDLFVVTPAGGRLLRGSPDGALADTTDLLPGVAQDPTLRAALWLDADHDGDLDLLLGRDGAPNLLFNNNSDPARAVFTETAAGSDLAAAGEFIAALPGDLDGDRDLDLVLLAARGPARLLLGELGGRFRLAPGTAPLHGEGGGVLQDFDGDGRLDLVTLPAGAPAPRLHRGDGRGGFGPAETLATAGSPRGLRAADVDLDGDLDLALVGRGVSLLLNDGTGRFVPARDVWPDLAATDLAGAELADLTGDLVPDLLAFTEGAVDRAILRPGVVEPAPRAVALAPTGVRSRDKRTRSPASGYGVVVTVRAGLREHSRLASGLAGGPNQSPLPLVFGLGPAPHADYARLAWPDGVAQTETALPAGRVHAVAETQRKVSSCPVLFTWNGREFEFITDFAGVGGLGYLAAPGEYTCPQPVDHVKIEPHQLRVRDGRYELRITEPMEESAYFDQVELVAIDHPAGAQVFPDERLAVTGPPPTRELLVVSAPVFAERAFDPAGRECAAALRTADRRYAFEPELDRRFIGFCVPHTLELDFGTHFAAAGADERVFLFINGYLEYPYSQTTYAAGQAQVAWQPIRIDRQQPDGSWRTIVPDAGALGGMARTMTVDLTGLVGGGACRLRLTSNLEMFYDQIFLARTAAPAPGSVHRLAPAAADLRYVGIAREVSPDGRLPLVYDYQQTDVDVPFRSLSGAYTRYGPVRELLAEADDLFALLATGDELAVSFDATALPAPAPGQVRSFVLVSHAYCKDMDRYTATPETLEPMPFRAMSRYPYPESERPAETEAQRRVRETYNTRIVE